MHVLEGYTRCPHCGQKEKFKEPQKVKIAETSMKIGK